MTAYFWVGGTGTLNNTATTHISLSSGGTAAAGPVTATDTITFDSNSGIGTVTIAATSCAGFTVTPTVSALTFAGTAALTISGSIDVEGGTWSAYAGTIKFTSTTTGNTITFTPSITTGSVEFDDNGSGGGWTLGSNISLGAAGEVLMQAGSLNSGGFNLSANTLQCSGSGTKTLTFTGSETWTFTGTGLVVDFAGSKLTITPASATIAIVGTGGVVGLSSAISGLTYPVIAFSGSATVYELVLTTGSFAGITAPSGSTVALPSSGTLTLTSAAGLSINGTGSAQTILQPTSAAVATLSCASGTLSLSNVTLTNITATGGATFNALTSNGCVDGGGNTGWNFGTPPVGGKFSGLSMIGVG